MKVLTCLTLVSLAVSFAIASPVAGKTVWDQLSESAPRSVFDDIRDSAPKAPAEVEAVPRTLSGE